ncbi:unnamed protein product [Caenorhabditis brenneri]
MKSILLFLLIFLFCYGIQATKLFRVDVSGTVFQTTDDTLKNFNGTLKDILENPDSYKLQRQEYVFIDRDPTHFRTILNFMRDGHVALPDSSIEIQEILEEAKYYQLEGLVELCSQTARPGKYFHVIETDSEYANILANPRKPTVIVYFPTNIDGRVNTPVGLNKKAFVDKFQDRVDVYFKSKSGSSGTALPSWAWSVHSEKCHLESPEWSFDIPVYKENSQVFQDIVKERKDFIKQIYVALEHALSL